MDGNHITGKTNVDRNEEFLKAKKVLDRLIEHTAALATQAFDEAIKCCGEQELDARDQLEEVAACLKIAEGNLIMARSKAGRIDSGGIARSGST